MFTLTVKKYCETFSRSKGREVEISPVSLLMTKAKPEHKNTVY